MRYCVIYAGPNRRIVETGDDPVRSFAGARAAAAEYLTEMTAGSQAKLLELRRAGCYEEYEMIRQEREGSDIFTSPTTLLPPNPASTHGPAAAGSHTLTGSIASTEDGLRRVALVDDHRGARRRETAGPRGMMVQVAQLPDTSFLCRLSRKDGDVLLRDSLLQMARRFAAEQEMA